NRQLTAWIDAARLGDRMHLLGPRDDVPRLMASLDVLVSSSIGEGLPNAIGEAMACGTSCVVTDVGDCAAIVGNAGRVVPPSDAAALAQAVVEVLDLPEADRGALGSAARERVREHYELGAVARRYESVWEEVVGDVRDRRHRRLPRPT